MIKFILRRLGISFLVLLGGSLLMYVLTINSGDPLQDLRESNDPNRDNLIAQRSANMRLDAPWYERYGIWLAGVSRCVVGRCDLGVNREGIPVASLLGNAASATLRLVIFATVLAIFIGIFAGILSAIRQYSGFDYIITFLAFTFFSLPVFWAAVLLKDYGAIRFNNWIADPNLSIGQIAVTALVLALIVAGSLGGDAQRRVTTGAATFVIVFGVMFYFDAVNWYRQPAIGIGIVALASIGAAVITVVLTSGLANRNVLYAALTTVAAGIVSYFVFSAQLNEPTWGVLFALFGLAIVVAVVSGALWGGYSRRLAIWVSIITAVVMSVIIVVDKALSSWASYLGTIRNGRPVSTIGAQTPNFDGTFWQEFLDKGTQLILPTIVLTLISIASYSRYTRASMLEVLEQDYVRTARSKGLSERVVITKHAFRNALIPITTIVAFDFAGLIGGAVLTETVFGWKGMGELFRTGLVQVDPNPVMAFFLVTGTAAVVMNMLADIAYAFLDPRIRR